MDAEAFEGGTRGAVAVGIALARDIEAAADHRKPYPGPGSDM